MPKTFLTLSGGAQQRHSAVSESTGVAQADSIVATNAAGKIDASLLPPEVAITTESRETTEGLSGGDFVNEFDDLGTTKVRLADPTNGRPATGFVRNAFTIGQTATVLPLGQNNDALTALTPGTTYYLSPTAAGDIVTGAALEAAIGLDDLIQPLGIATSTTVLETGKYTITVNKVV